MTETIARSIGDLWWFWTRSLPFVGAGDAKERCLGERAAEELVANWEALIREAAWRGKGGLPGQVGREGMVNHGEDRRFAGEVRAR